VAVAVDLQMVQMLKVLEVEEMVVLVVDPQTVELLVVGQVHHVKVMLVELQLLVIQVAVVEQQLSVHQDLEDV
jgi:hypothetical protein